MSLSTITARVDKKDKADFDKFCSEVGLTASAAVNVYIKTVIREGRIPFEIKKQDHFYDEENIEYLEGKMRDYKSGRLKLSEHELTEN